MFGSYWMSWPELSAFVKIGPVYVRYDIDCFCHTSTVLLLISKYINKDTIGIGLYEGARG